MNSTQTGIAVALALAVIAVFFIFPGLWPFGGSSPATMMSEPSGATSTNDQSSSSMQNQNDQLQVTDESVGTGAVAAPGDSVTVNYVGSLTDGTVFDASANHGNQGFTFTLGAGQVISGWDQGIVGMKVGGKRKLVIPAALAYGASGVPGVIPANATLVFEVDLLSVQKAH